MFIYDIESGKEVELHITQGTNSLDFRTKVKRADAKSQSLITEAIVRDGKVVNITGSNIRVSLNYYPEGGLPIAFRNVKVSFTKGSDGKYLYKISAPVEGVGINRREHYRVFIGKDIALKCGNSKQTVDAVLKDISNSGVAFTLNSGDDNDCRVGQILYTEFIDNIEETFEHYTFQICAIVVRKEELENGKVVYGCLLNSRMPGLEKYIITKERISIQNRRGKM